MAPHAAWPEGDEPGSDLDLHVGVRSHLGVSLRTDLRHVWHSGYFSLDESSAQLPTVTVMWVPISSRSTGVILPEWSGAEHQTRSEMSGTNLRWVGSAEQAHGFAIPCHKRLIRNESGSSMPLKDILPLDRRRYWFDIAGFIQRKRRQVPAR